MHRVVFKRLLLLTVHRDVLCECGGQKRVRVSSATICSSEEGLSLDLMMEPFSQAGSCQAPVPSSTPPWGYRSFLASPGPLCRGPQLLGRRAPLPVSLSSGQGCLSLS